MCGWTQGFSGPATVKVQLRGNSKFQAQVLSIHSLFGGWSIGYNNHDANHSFVTPRSKQTTYTESCSRAREGVYEPRERINKNASDEVFDGGYR